MIVLFSYPLDRSLVMPGAIPKPEVILRSRMVPPPLSGVPEGVRWNSYNNTSFVKLFTHTGTHIDTPFHVDPQGAKLGDFQLEDFVFDAPSFIQIPKSDFELITPDDLVPHTRDLARADIVLIYTGFSQFRSVDPDRYLANQPSLSPEAAEYLVTQCPNLRCVALDTMGIENIEAGRKSDPPFPTHRKLLLSGKSRFLLLEDPNLSTLVGRRLKRVFLIPLLIPDAEAMPVTAFAEVEG